jgi:hypothetical protein
VTVVVVEVIVLLTVVEDVVDVVIE